MYVFSSLPRGSPLLTTWPHPRWPGTSLCCRRGAPGFGRWGNLRPVGDEDGRGCLMAHSGPFPWTTLALWSSQGDRIQCCPQSHIVPGLWAYLTLSRFLRGAQRGQAGGSDGGALCGRPHLPPALAGLLPFSSRRLITVMEACPLSPLHSTVLWLEGHSHLLFFCSLCGFCSLPVCPPRALLGIHLYTSGFQRRGARDRPSERWCALFVLLCKRLLQKSKVFSKQGLNQCNDIFFLFVI